MQERHATASTPTQARSRRPDRPNRDLTHVRANTLAFWRVKLDCAVYDYRWFPSESTRRHAYDMLRMFKRKQREHWREHDPLRWRAAVAQDELNAAEKSLADCLALGMPDVDERAECDRLRRERDAALLQLGRRATAWQSAEAQGRVKRVSEFVKTGRTVVIDGERVPIVRRVRP